MDHSPWSEGSLGYFQWPEDALPTLDGLHILLMSIFGFTASFVLQTFLGLAYPLVTWIWLSVVDAISSHPFAFLAPLLLWIVTIGTVLFVPLGGST